MRVPLWWKQLGWRPAKSMAVAVAVIFWLAQFIVYRRLTMNDE